MSVKLSPDDPRIPTKWDVADAAAIKALVRGEATPDQQKHAINFIITNIAKRDDLSYRPNPYDTAFAEGMRFVGSQVVKLININLEIFKKVKINE